MVQSVYHFVLTGTESHDTVSDKGKSFFFITSHKSSARDNPNKVTADWVNLKVYVCMYCTGTKEYARLWRKTENFKISL